MEHWTLDPALVTNFKLSICRKIPSIVLKANLDMQMNWCKLSFSLYVHYILKTITSQYLYSWFCDIVKSQQILFSADFLITRYARNQESENPKNIVAILGNRTLCIQQDLIVVHVLPAVQIKFPARIVNVHIHTAARCFSELLPSQTSKTQLYTHL